MVQVEMSLEIMCCHSAIRDKEIIETCGFLQGILSPAFIVDYDAW